MGLGKFIDSTELRRREHSRVSDVLRGIPGLNLVKFRPCPRGSYLCEPEEFRAASGRGEVSLGRMYRDPEDAYCWMSVILDGSYLYRSGSGRSGRPPDFGKDFRVADLESIEVYRSSAELPPEFGGTSGACGTVVLWSRRG